MPELKLFAEIIELPVAKTWDTAKVSEPSEQEERDQRTGTFPHEAALEGVLP